MAERVRTLRFAAAAIICLFSLAATFCWSDPLWLGLAVLGGLFVPGPRPARERLDVNDERVRRELTDGRVEAVRWTELERVAIVTTDEGPFAEDFFWALQSASGDTCVVAAGLASESGLIARLLSLPGFDHEAFLQACTSCENATFPCWERPLP